jgi:cytochrome c
VRAYTSCNEARKAVKQRRKLEPFETPARRYLVSRASAAEGTQGSDTMNIEANKIAGVVFAPHKPAVPGFDLPSEEPAAAGGAAAAPVAEEPIAVRLAKADPAKGEKATAACKACHTFEKGGANKVGPHLFDVYGRSEGSIAGFGYSAAMKGRNDKTWDAEGLDHFLKSPKAYVPGTIMAFAGIAKPETRADVVAYLNSLSEAPKPLPKP